MNQLKTIKHQSLVFLLLASVLFTAFAQAQIKPIIAFSASNSFNPIALKNKLRKQSSKQFGLKLFRAYEKKLNGNLKGFMKDMAGIRIPKKIKDPY